MFKGKIRIIAFCFCVLFISGGESNGDNNTENLFNQARSLYREKEYLESMALLREIKESYPDSEASIQARAGIVDCYHKIKDYKLSTEHGNRFLKDYPDHPFAENVELLVARSLLRDKQYDEAAKKYQEFITKHQGSDKLGEAYYFLGNCYGEPAIYFRDKRKLFKQALSCYRIVVNDYSDSDWVDSAIRQIGMTYYQLGNYEEGIAYLNKYLDKHKSGRLLGGTLYYLAACHKGLGNMDEAKKLYNRVIEELPNTKWEELAKRALAKL